MSKSKHKVLDFPKPLTGAAMSSPSLGARVNCDRCGREIELRARTREDSAPFRLAVVAKGVCPDCVMTQWLYNTYPINMQLDQSGPDVLLNPAIREAFLLSGILENCDMGIDEVNWERVVVNWNLPVEQHRNLYTMGNSARADIWLRRLEDGLHNSDFVTSRMLMTVGIEQGKAVKAVQSDDGTMVVTEKGSFRLPELRQRRTLRMIIEQCRFCHGRRCLSCETEQKSERQKQEAQAIEAGALPFKKGRKAR